MLFLQFNDLAKAHEERVLKLWQGLGYYSRARNLHKTARLIVKEYHGIFPNTYKDLIQLPGIGPYTASAISSILVLMNRKPLSMEMYIGFYHDFSILTSQ